MRILFTLILLSGFYGKAQNVNLDSLWLAWENKQNADSIRLEALHGYTNEMVFINPDSSFYFIQVLKKEAKKNENRYFEAKSYDLYGTACSILSKNEEAGKAYKQALQLKRSIQDLPGEALTLNSLAYYYFRIGNLDSTLSYSSLAYQQSIELKNDDLISKSCLFLGLAHQSLAQYEPALDAFKNGIDAIYRSNNLRDLSYFIVQTGNCYFSLGNNKQALAYYQKAVAISKETGNESSLASTFNNMGLILYKQEQYDSAITCFQKGLVLNDQMHHVQGVMYSHEYLGNAYVQKGELDSALIHYNKGIQLAEESKNVTVHASMLAGLSVIEVLNGNDSTAISYGKNALEKGYLSQQPNLIRSTLENLFRLNVKLKTYDQAYSYLNGIQEIVQLNLVANFPILNEKEKELYLATLSDDFDRLYALSNISEMKLENITERCYNSALLTKCLLLKSSTYLIKTIQESGDEALIENYTKWIALKEKIAELSTTKKDVDELIEEAGNLERELVKQSRVFADFNAVLEVNWKEVQSKLKEGETAIEFVRYDLNKSTYTQEKGAENSVYYCAYLIKKNSNSPILIKLFEEKKLEEILGVFPGNNVSYIEQIYGTEENTNTQLYDMLWKPFEKELKGIKKVYVSPVGLLHKISFAALAKEQNVYLCDLYDIELKSSTSKIINPTEVSLNKTSSTAMFGGIDYSSDSAEYEVWSYLEGTLSETQQIEALLKKGKRKYQHFNQKDATEAQFKRIANQSNIIHIASHGFFYADPDLINEEFESDEETEGELVFRGGRSGVGMENFVQNKNPLMRSGLAFAGANAVWNQSTIDGEDGVLTAAEVATIDLRNTDLVVLSACETGLGDIKGSEGVYGLQRSFKMAGAKYVIMSLWQVPDTETAEFMTTFYKYLIKSNNIQESFNLTQKSMRKKYDPYFWAAFVLID